MTTEQEYIAEKAAELVGNWERFECFFWHDKPENPEDWCIVYTSNRDADVLTRANAQVIDRELEPFVDSGDICAESHSHWAVGYVDGYSIRVYKPETTEPTEAFATYAKLMLAAEDYPILDEHVFSELECEDENQAWENWVADEFCDELGIDFEPTCQSDGSFELFAFFDEAREAANEYWEHDNSGPHIDLAPIVAKACFRPLPDGSSCRHCEADLSGKTTAGHESECPL